MGSVSPEQLGMGRRRRWWETWQNCRSIHPHPCPKADSREFFRSDLKGRRKEPGPWLRLLPTGRSGSTGWEIPPDTSRAGRISPWYAKGRPMAGSYGTHLLFGGFIFQAFFPVDYLRGSSFARCSFAYLCLVGYRALRSKFLKKKKIKPSYLLSWVDCSWLA